MAEAEKQEVAERVLEGVANPDANREMGFSSIEGAIEHFLKEKGYDTSEESKKAITDTLYNYAKLARDKVLLTNAELKSKGKDQVEVPSELELVTKTVNFLMKEEKNFKIVYDKDKNIFDLDQFQLTGEPHQVYKILYVQNEVQKFIDKLPPTTPHLQEIKEYLTAFVVEHSFLKRLNAVEKGSKGPGEFQSLKDTMKALNGKDDTPSVLKGVTFDEKTGLKFEYNPGMDDNAKKLFEQALANTNTNKQNAKEKAQEADAKIEDVSNENPNPEDNNSKDNQDDNTKKIKEIKKFGPVEKTLGEQINDGFYNGKWLAKYIGNLLKTLGNVDVYISDDTKKTDTNSTSTPGDDNKDQKPKLYDKDGNELNVDPSNFPEMFEKIMRGELFVKGKDDKLVPLTWDMLMGMNGLANGQKGTMEDMMFSSEFLSTPGMMTGSVKPYSPEEARKAFGYQLVADILSHKLKEDLFEKDKMFGGIIKEDEAMEKEKGQLLKDCHHCLLLLGSDANFPLNRITITLPSSGDETKLVNTSLKDLVTNTINIFEKQGRDSEDFKKMKSVIEKLKATPAKDLIPEAYAKDEKASEAIMQCIVSVLTGIEHITEIFEQKEIQDIFECTKSVNDKQGVFGSALTDDALSKLNECKDFASRQVALLTIADTISGQQKELVQSQMAPKHGDITAYVQLLLEEKQRLANSAQQQTTDADMTM